MANLKRKALWIAGGVILAVIVLIILILLFGVKALKPRIEATASKALGMEVRIRGGMSVSFIPVFGASLADITVKNAGADVATVAKMKIGLKLLPLIRHRFEISRLDLIKPVISIIRQKNGKLNIDTATSEPWVNPVTVKKLAISQGSLFYSDLISGEKIELEGVDISAANLSAGGTPGAQLKALSFSDDIRCRTIKAGSVTLTDLVMRIAGGNGVFDVSHSGARVLGGTGSGTLHADFTGAEPHFKIMYSLTRLKIAELLQEPPKAMSIEGLADFTADLTARGKTAVEMKRSLSGQISLDGENIALNTFDIDDMIPSLERSQSFNLVDIGGFFLAGPLGSAVVRGYKFADFYNESHGGKGIIARLVSVWKVGNGVAEAVDVALATKKYRIAMHGGLNFISDRFEAVTAAVVDQRGCAVFSQKISGPFSNPAIGKINILGSLTGPITSLFGKVKRLFVHPKCVLFYSGSVAPPVITNKLP
jgi:AsmA protein